MVRSCATRASPLSVLPWEEAQIPAKVFHGTYTTWVLFTARVDAPSRIWVLTVEAPLFTCSHTPGPCSFTAPWTADEAFLTCSHTPGPCSLTAPCTALAALPAWCPTAR